MNPFSLSSKLARTKRFFAAAFVLALFPATVQAYADEDACSVLAGMNTRQVYDALMSFSGPVLGKHPEDWTVSDLENLANNARRCDRKPEGASTKVKAGVWVSLTDRAKTEIIPVAVRSTDARNFFHHQWQRAKLPHCADLLRWKRDPVWLRNNSEEIFGVPLGEMTNGEREVALSFAKACQPVMESILKLWKQKPGAAGIVVEDIGISSERDAQAKSEAEELQQAYISVEWQGWAIPRAYLGSTARKMVEMAERGIKENGRLSLEQMTILSSWIETVKDNGKEGPDRAYANFIKSLIASQMFRNQ